jgi:aspartate-semialdehyde dehydrogenase
MQMVVALKPIYDAVGIKRINVATYQAVSGAGKRAIDELVAQTRAILSGESPIVEVMPKQIAFNAVPHIDSFQENGYTREEMKMVWETQKIFEDESILVNPTAVRIPVFYGHSEAVHVETNDPITASEAKNLLMAAAGVTVLDERSPGGYPTAVTEAANDNQVYVGRIRKDITCDNGINLWIVSDNIRKGAALNSIQISEKLLNTM